MEFGFGAGIELAVGGNVVESERGQRLEGAALRGRVRTVERLKEGEIGEH